MLNRENSYQETLKYKQKRESRCAKSFIKQLNKNIKRKIKDGAFRASADSKIKFSKDTQNTISQYYKDLGYDCTWFDDDFLTVNWNKIKQ